MVVVGIVISIGNAIANMIIIVSLIATIVALAIVVAIAITNIIAIIIVVVIAITLRFDRIGSCDLIALGMIIQIYGPCVSLRVPRHSRSGVNTTTLPEARANQACARRSR